MSHPDHRSTSPDAATAGFLDHAVDPLRYDRQPNDPDEIVGVLSSMIADGARVLDIGCGTGSVSAQLISNRNLSLVGIEPDPSRAQAARDRGIDVRSTYLSTDLIRELGPFDVVLFADVLEHLPDPWKLLVLAKGALAPSGRVIVSVPNVAHWSVRADLLRGRFRYQDTGIMDATHLRWFTEVGIRQLLASAQLSVESVRATAGVDLPCYYERLPWRRMSWSTRAAIVRRASRRWPRLFGCQWVLSGCLSASRAMTETAITS